MPNHVQNILTGPEALVRELWAVPSPAMIERARRDLAASPHPKGREETLPADYAYTEIGSFQHLLPQPKNIEVGGCSGKHEDGVVCWYEWDIANWGTKWDMYEEFFEVLEDGQARLSFQTAWSTPLPVIRALAAKHPEAEFTMQFADEDFGRNCGILLGKDGDVLVIDEVLADGDPYEFTIYAARIHGYEEHDIIEMLAESIGWNQGLDTEAAHEAAQKALASAEGKNPFERVLEQI